MSERQLFQRVKTTALQRRHGWAASGVSGPTPQDSPQDSEDGEHCVAGDAAHVAAIPSHPHEAAFSPSASPAEEWKWKQQTKYIGKKKTVVNLHELLYLIVFFWPILDDPVVLATLGAISNQHHSMIQVVGVTVGLFKYSCKGNKTYSTCFHILPQWSSITQVNKHGFMLEGDRNMVVSGGGVDTWLRGLVPNLGEVLVPFMASQRGRFPHIFWQLEQKKRGVLCFVHLHVWSVTIWDNMVKKNISPEL